MHLREFLLRNTAVDAVPFTWFFKNAESETDEKMSRYNNIAILVCIYVGCFSLATLHFLTKIQKKR